MIENTRFLDAGLELAGREARGLFQRPDDVVADPHMSPAEKRALLASWASDARAVRGVPALRQLEDGSHVAIDDILSALQALDPEGVVPSSRTQLTLSRLAERRRRPVARDWGRILRRRSRDDDDDPPPCPAHSGIPPRQGGGGAFVFPEPVAA